VGGGWNRVGVRKWEAGSVGRGRWEGQGKGEGSSSRMGREGERKRWSMETVEGKRGMG